MSVLLATQSDDGLEPVLDAWRAQTCGPDAFELIVAGDGLDQQPSGPAVFGLNVRMLRREHATQAAALNSALAAAAGRIVLLTTDEVLPAADCIAAHLAFHKEWALETWSAIGPVLAPDDRARPQVESRSNGQILSHLDFRLGNVSVKRQFIGDDRFDDSFGRDSWLDVDFGFRLRRIKGMQLKYLPAATCSRRREPESDQQIDHHRAAGWYEMAFYEKHDQLLGPGLFGDIFSTAWHSLSALWTFSHAARAARRSALARMRGHWLHRLGRPAG